jgi:hypothetical protein
MSKIGLTAAISTFFFLSACNSKPDAASNTSSTSTSNSVSAAAANASAPVAVTAPNTTMPIASNALVPALPTTTSDVERGDLAQSVRIVTIDADVPECVNYQSKILGCIMTKAPPSEQGRIAKAMQDALQNQNPNADKAMMAKICTDAMAQAPKFYGSMGCTF